MQGLEEGFGEQGDYLNSLFWFSRFTLQLCSSNLRTLSQVGVYPRARYLVRGYHVQRIECNF